MIENKNVAVTTALALLALTSQAHSQLLGSAGKFAVLAGASVTNTGSTVLAGDLGVSPGTTVTGFPPGAFSWGSIHAGDSIASQAQLDLTSAFNLLGAEAPTEDLTGQDLGGLTLLPGVYHFDASAPLDGMLTLNTLGNPNARFDFQIGSTLLTGANASVRIINAARDMNIYWQVGSSATLATGTVFQGHILAYTSIGLGVNASIFDGGALAENGSVTMSTNQIAAVPEPMPFLAFGVGLVILLRRRAG